MNFLLALLRAFGFAAAELFAPRPGRNIQEESGCQETKFTSAEGLLSSAASGEAAGAGLGAARCSCELPPANVSSPLHHAFTFIASAK